MRKIKKAFKHPEAKEKERILFKKRIEQYKAEGRILSYIDESGFALDMARTYGYAKVGDRCYDTHNWNAGRRENAIGALINNSLTACGIVNGNVDSDTFNIWLEKNISSEAS